MSAKIKLQRLGTKSKPFYRVVVQDESSSPASDVVAVLGQYQPLKGKAEFNLDKEKTLAWIKKGAKPTEKVRILLGKAGILPPVDLAALPKRKKKGESSPSPEAPVAEAPAKTPVEVSAEPAKEA